jgi:hypothetical protein
MWVREDFDRQGVEDEEPEWMLGTCDWASKVLADALIASGFEARLFHGTYHDHDDTYPERLARKTDIDPEHLEDPNGSWGHWWVVCEGLIVDITSDQFNEADEARKVVVLQDGVFPYAPASLEAASTPSP